MTLLLTTVPEALQWLRARVTGTLQIDSRLVQPGDGFIAWPGAATDGRTHVADALARGAVACLVERDGAEPFGFAGDHIAMFAGLKAATGPLAHAWFGEPTTQLQVLAVTGTNGKTSTSWWLAGALNLLSKSERLGGAGCAVVGTLGMGVPSGLEATGMTTPDPVRLHRAFRQMVQDGVRYCAIEASSIGLAEHRLDGVAMGMAVLTNFTQDHLDYHGSMAAYWQAKRALFAWPGLRTAIINIDDPAGRDLQAELANHAALDVWSVSMQAPQARLRATDVSAEAAGLRFTVREGAESAVLQSRVIGHYNILNLLGVVAALRSLGYSLQAAVAACAVLEPVPGRMQQLAGPEQPLVAVDYAHTPDALDKALLALKPVAQQRGGQLWCVFGCGGDRDAAKRPLMGAVAQRHADWVVVTSDNPRSEVPNQIIHQIMLGTIAGETVRAEPDRAAAIRLALAEADARDVVLIAGKGHEEYQETGGVKTPFSDLEHARRALQRRMTTSMMTLNEALALIQPRIPEARLVGDGSIPLARVHTDTRTLQQGDLFVALKGERFDANDFLADARSAGAAAALAHGGLAAAGLHGIEVPDTLRALGALATGWRARHAMPLIGVTGSNGKTTVTQMIASILRAWQGDAAFATQGNFNNDIGVPLMLCRLTAAHRAAVIEMGMNHPGEIAYLAGIAAPTVALVNNAQREHLEFMHTVQAVAQENGSVLQSLPGDGVAVFPAGDEFTSLWRELAGPRRMVTFGTGGDVLAQEVQWRHGAWKVQIQTPAGGLACTLQIAGRHNVANALAAAACAWAAGAPLDAIARGLNAFTPVKGRSRAFSATVEGREVTVVDDTYNANPDSMRAAIEVLAELPTPQLLVMGDMGEVGEQGPQFHTEAGAFAREAGLARLFTLGAQSAHAAAAFAGAQHFTDMAALKAAVCEALPSVGSVLVKGSRFMKMEQVVEAITAATAPATPRNSQEGAQ